VTDTIRRTTLANGVDVITDRMPGRHFAHVAVQVRVGAMHEPDAASGISHLLERVIFRGTTEMSGSAIQHRFARAGARLNGSVREDETRFEAELPADAAADAVAWLGELVTAPALREADIELERQIVEQENCRGCFGCTMREAVYSEAFPGQSVRNPVIGHEDTVAAFGAGDLRAWHQKHYVGANLAVIVAGDVDHDAIVGVATRAFGHLPAGAAAALPRLAYTPGAAQLASTCPQAALWVVVPLLGTDVATFRSLAILREVLAGGPHGLLLQELRETRGLVYDAACFVDALGPDGALHIQLAGEAPKMREIFEVTCATLHRVARGLAPEDLELARAQMLARILRGSDMHDERADWLCRDLVEVGSPQDTEAERAAFRAMGADEIERAAEMVLATPPSFAAQGPTRHLPREADLRAIWAGTALRRRPRRLFAMAG
jgi:predicted Zn-dependent peptidase